VRQAGRLLDEAKAELASYPEAYAEQIGKSWGITVADADLLIRAHKENLGSPFTNERLFLELELLMAVCDVVCRMKHGQAA